MAVKTPTIRMPAIRTDVVDFTGGLDQITPVYRRKPGTLIDAVNFQAIATGGYERIGGYERFDGRAKPSSATYTIIQVVSFDNVPTVGQTLIGMTGMTSGATGTIIVVNEALQYMALTLTTGTFSDTEVVKVGATTIGTATPVTVIISSLLNAQYLNLAADESRALIAAVPGSGPVRGVVGYNVSGVHTVYAFRDNVGATKVELYKSSSSGWTLVPFYYEVSFSAGSGTPPADGVTLTQGANSATLKRTALESGSWTGADAAGRFIVTQPTPGSFSAGALTAGATATLDGAETVITLTVGGTFDFDEGNFSGQAISRRVYGADGVNRGFEFDGDVLAPIDTGFSNDKPKYVRVHQHHLIFSFAASLGTSGIGLPFDWQAGSGASEIAVSDNITGLRVIPGDQLSPALFVGARQLNKILYGTAATGSDLFRLVDFNPGIGCLDRGLQVLDRLYTFDDRGLIDLRAALEFGNFLHATLTYPIQPYISAKRSLLAATTISKDRSQYRALFSDGSALYATIVNGKLIGMMPQLFPDPVFCAFNGELANGNDVTYLGAASSGHVYELDKGSSFDGANIDAYITFSWNFQKSPRIVKKYRHSSLEVHGNFYAFFSVGFSLGYKGSRIDQPTPVTYESAFEGSSFWDSATWDQFVWDGLTLSPTEVELDGSAENIQFTFSLTTDYIHPFTLASNVIHYSPRRAIR